MPLRKKLDYELHYDTNVVKYLKKLVKKDKETVIMLLNTIEEIHEYPYNSDILKGNKKGDRKKRKGDYRIIYRIDNAVNPPQIRISKVGHRKKVYKR